MVDDRRNEEEEHQAPAENFGERAFRRVGPGGVLDHTAMMGTLDTTDTGAHGTAALEKLAPIFAVAHAYDMAVAARALDPDDEGVSEDMVTTSQGLTVVQGDPEGDKRRVLDNAKRAQSRLSDDDTDFDPNFVAHYDRRAEAERAWVVSMADMQPSMVVGVTPQQMPAPSEEAQQEREDAFAEQQAAQEREREQQEQPETQVPQQRPASEPTAAPQQQEAPVVEPKQFSEEEDKGAEGEKEDFNALWTEASERTRTQVSEALKESKKPQEPASEKPKKPNQASSKSDWIAWALYVDPTLSEEKAKAMNRKDLIDEYIKAQPPENK